MNIQFHVYLNTTNLGCYSQIELICENIWLPYHNVDHGKLEFGWDRGWKWRYSDLRSSFQN